MKIRPAHLRAIEIIKKRGFLERWDSYYWHPAPAPLRGELPLRPAYPFVSRRIVEDLIRQKTFVVTAISRGTTFSRRPTQVRLRSDFIYAGDPEWEARPRRIRAAREQQEQQQCS